MESDVIFFILCFILCRRFVCLAYHSPFPPVPLIGIWNAANNTHSRFNFERHNTQN